MKGLSMAHAIRIQAAGGPEVLKWEAIEVGKPGPGEVRLRQSAVGLNYIDVYHRSGLYKLANFPAIIGMEGAGTVEAVGPGVTELKVGDRVAYAGVLGAWSASLRPCASSSQVSSFFLLFKANRRTPEAYASAGAWAFTQARSWSSTR